MAGNAVIGAVRAVLGIDTAQFETGLKNAQSKLAGFGKGAALGFGAVAAAAATMGAAVAVGVGKALKDADDLGKMAQKTGVAVDQLSRLKYAGDLADVSLDSLGTGLKLLSKNMVATAAGGGPAAKAFSALGISVTDASGKLKSNNTVLEEVAGKFGGMQDGAAKTALALGIFGKSGSDLIPLLNAGKDGLKEMTDEADRLGLTIDAKTAAAAETFNDNLTRLGAVMGGVTTRIAAGLAPTLANLSGVLVKVTQNQSLMAGVSKVLEISLKGLVTAGVIVGAAFTAVASVVGRTAQAIYLASKGQFGDAAAAVNKGFADAGKAVVASVGLIKDVWVGTGNAIAASAPDTADKIAAPLIKGRERIEKEAKKVKSELDKLKERLADVQADLQTPEEREFTRMREQAATLWQGFGAKLIDEKELRGALTRVFGTPDAPKLTAPIKFEGSLKDLATLELPPAKNDEVGTAIAYAFADGVQAEMHGDLGRFLKSTLGGIANSAFSRAFKGLGDSLSKSLGSSLGGVFKSGGIGGALANGALGIGLSLLGGLFGGDKVIGKVNMSAEDRRALQGVGTVLGSVKSQSQSIAHSLTAAEKYQNQDLQFGSAQVEFLRAIRDGIATLTTTLGRDIGVGGGLDTSRLGLGTKGKTETTLVDQGVDLGGGRLGDYIDGRIQGQFYQATQSVKTKKGFLGIGAGTTTTNRLLTSAIGEDVTAAIARVMGEVNDGIVGALAILGVDGAQELLSSFNIEIGKISLEGLDAAQIAEQLGAVFSKVGDQLAAVALPALAQFQKAGEGAFETLQRLATEYVTIDTVLSSVGLTFASIGVASLEARSRLVELSGGLEALASQGAFFAQNFLTAAEQLEPIQKAVAAEMERLGLAGVTTKAQFAQLVRGLDVSTEEGAALYAALMKVAPAFAKVADAADVAAQASREATDAAVESARADALAALEAERDRLQAVASEWRGLGEDMAAFAKTLSSAGGVGASLGALTRQFQDVAAGVALGDRAAFGEFREVASNFKAAFDANSHTALEQRRNDARIRLAAEKGAEVANRQASIAELQLEGINATVAALGGVKDAVLSIPPLLQALAAAFLAQATLATPTRNFGANAGVNAVLASATGYAGDFGTGGFQNFILGADAAAQAAARSILNAFGQTERIVGFASGGYGQIGGPAGIDKALTRMRLSAGEFVSVSHNDPMAVVDGLSGEIRALRQEMGQLLAQTVANTGKAARALTDVQGVAVRATDPALPITVAIAA